MKRISLSLAVAVFFVGILGGKSSALAAGAFTMDVSQTLPSLTYGTSNPDGGNTVGTTNSIQFRNQSASNWREIGQSFTTTSSYDMQGVVLEVAVGTYSLGAAVPMTFEIYEFDNASDTTPGSTANPTPIATYTSTIFSGSTITSTYSYTSSSYFFLTFNFDSAISLQSGKTYGFVMSLESTASGGINILNSATGYSSGALMYISNSNPTTYTATGDAAFYIIAVPEASTVMLMILGTVGICASHRLRRLSSVA